MTDDTVASLDAWDITRRAERARAALLAAIRRVSDEQFKIEPAGEWGVARILCHVVWVENYWALTLDHLRGSSEEVVEISEGENAAIAQAASQRSGTPEEPLPAPPPYADRREALGYLDSSRRAFLATLDDLSAAQFLKRLSSPRGEVSLRFAIEHVIEHDWDHAMQISQLGG